MLSEWGTTLLLGAALYLGYNKIRKELRSFKKEYSFFEQLEYKTDYLLSIHPEYKTYALCYICILLIVAGGIFFFSAKLLSATFMGSETFGFPASLKRSWTFLLDNSAHLDEEELLPIIVGFVLSIGGMLVDALLVGLVADALAQRMDSLKHGLSKVLEENHTLILGWNDKVLPLIREIAEANLSEGGGVVVVMSEREKGEMEEEISRFFTAEDLKGTVVIVRSGNPMLVSDLEKVSANHARSVAVMSHDGDPDESDSKAVRIVLALCGGVRIKGHAVVELRDIDNKELVQLVSEQRVEVMVSHDIIGRLMIQCARQRGLAHTYTSLLGFEDNEFYLQHWPKSVGKTFNEVAFHFHDAVACGVKQAQPDDPSTPILLNPPRDYVVRDGDEILVLAEDDDTYTFSDSPSKEALVRRRDTVVSKWAPAAARVEQILFCGWRRDLDDMIVELDKCVTEGSELHILSTIPIDERGVLLEEGGMSHLDNLKIVHHVGNMVLRRRLEELPLETFDSILILAEDDADATVADSRSLSSLLLIRDIQQKRPTKHCTVISEIMDPRTKQLVSVAQISDYVVSNELVSMSLAMVLERREINYVLSELFTAEGSEIFMRDIRYYAEDGERLNFWQLLRRAGARQEVLLGYKRGDSDVILNPTNKSEAMTWSTGDTMVVIAVD